MTIDDRRKCLCRIEKLYIKASRKERGQLLDEMKAVTGPHRNSLGRVMNSTLERQPRWRQRGWLFPEEVTFCGPAPAYLAYTDPGLPLARKVREVLIRYLEDWGEPPKVILMQNHGLIALGRTAAEAETITAVYVKTARVLLGTYALGGPHFMSAQDVRRIHTRPDETYRRQKLT